MSIVATRIQNIRAISALDKNETRPSRYGALDFFMTDTDAPGGIVSEDLKTKAWESIGSTLEVPVIKFDSGVSIGNTRTLTIADSENTSAMYSVAFTTFAWGFTMTPALYHNNEIAYQKDFDAKFIKYLYEFADTLDSACITKLAAEKTQVFKDPLLYTITGNSVQVPNGDKGIILGDLNVLLAANDHFGQTHIIGNGGVESLVRQLAEKDIYNSENKTLQYSDKILHFSNRVANAVGKYGTGFAVQEGTTGMLMRMERESLRRAVSRTGHEWDIVTLPMIGMPVGTYYYESVGDQSTIAGAASADMDRAMKEHYGFAVDIAIITNYNSDPTTIANPIIKFEIAKPA